MKYALVLLLLLTAGCSSGKYIYKDYGGPKTKHHFTEGEERNYKITLTSTAGRNDTVMTKIFFKMNLNIKITKATYNRYESVWTYSNFKISGFPGWVPDLVTDTDPWVFDVTIREKDSLLFYRQSPNGYDMLSSSLYNFINKYRSQLLTEHRFTMYIIRFYEHLASELIEENKQSYSLTTYNGLPIGDSVKSITTVNMFEKHDVSTYSVKYALPRDSAASLYHIYSHFSADSMDTRMAMYRYLSEVSGEYGLDKPELIDIPYVKYLNDATLTFYKSGWLKMKKSLKTISNEPYFDNFEVMVYEAGS